MKKNQTTEAKASQTAILTAIKSLSASYFKSSKKEKTDIFKFLK